MQGRVHERCNVENNLSDTNAHTVMPSMKTARMEDRVAAVSSPEPERRDLEILNHAMNDRRSKAGKTYPPPSHIPWTYSNHVK